MILRPFRPLIILPFGSQTFYLGDGYPITAKGDAMATGRPAISMPPPRINSFATPKPPPEKPRALISQYNLEWGDLKTFLESKFRNYEIKNISIVSLRTRCM